MRVAFLGSNASTLIRDVTDYLRGPDGTNYNAAFLSVEDQRLTDFRERYSLLLLLVTDDHVTALLGDISDALILTGYCGPAGRNIWASSTGPKLDATLRTIRDIAGWIAEKYEERRNSFRVEELPADGRKLNDFLLNEKCAHYTLHGHLFGHDWQHYPSDLVSRLAIKSSDFLIGDALRGASELVGRVLAQSADPDDFVKSVLGDGTFSGNQFAKYFVRVNPIDRTNETYICDAAASIIQCEVRVTRGHAYIEHSLGNGAPLRAYVPTQLMKLALFDETSRHARPTSAWTDVLACDDDGHRCVVWILGHDGNGFPDAERLDRHYERKATKDLMQRLTSVCSVLHVTCSPTGNVLRRLFVGTETRTPLQSELYFGRHHLSIRPIGNGSVYVLVIPTVEQNL